MEPDEKIVTHKWLYEARRMILSETSLERVRGIKNVMNFLLQEAEDRILGLSHKAQETQAIQAKKEREIQS